MLEGLQLPKGRGRIPLPLEEPIARQKPLYVRNQSVKNLYFILDTFHLEKLNEEQWDAGRAA